MDRSATALKSFCEDDEAWVDSWRVSAVGRGWNAAMPGFSKETVGLTDRRLLWLDETLETVELADVESVTTDDVGHQSAPGTVRAGAVALVLGGILSAVTLYLFSFPLVASLLPLAGGAGVFVLSVGFTRARERSGAEVMQHRLRIETADGAVVVWGDGGAVVALADAVDPDADSDT